MSAKTMTSAALAVMLIAQPIAAVAQEQSCVPLPDAQTMGVALLPKLVDLIADRRATILSADAPLVARDIARWGELEAARVAALLEATAAAGRAVGALPAEMRQADGTPEPALPSVEKRAGDAVTNGSPTQTYTKVSQVLETLSPMPSANLVRSMTMMLTATAGSTVVCQLGQQPNGPSVRSTTRTPAPPPRPGDLATVPPPPSPPPPAS